MRYEQKPPESSKIGLVIDFINDRFWSLIALVTLLFAVRLYIGYEPEIPRFWQISGFAALVVLPWGYLVGSKIVDWFFEPHIIYVVDLDASIVESALYAFPYDDFLELDVIEGAIDQVAPALAFAKDIDQDELTAKGTWRGTLTDRELLRALHLVDQCRGQLEDDAKKGFVFETVGWSILRNGIRETTRYVVDTFADGSLPDRGYGLDSAVDDALEAYDLKEELQRHAEDLDLEEESEIEDVGTESSTEDAPSVKEVSENV